MKKLDNFSCRLELLKTADFDIAYENEIYAKGVISLFNLTFDLACKFLKELMIDNGSLVPESTSPREILQLGYRQGYIDDTLGWSQMLKSRNLSVHVYDEDYADSLLVLIRDSYISNFDKLLTVLKEKSNTVI